MATHTVRIKSIEKVTHDVLRIVSDKPSQYKFEPGQATSVAINKPDWKSKKRPFTFTSLPGDDHLEFIIKIYPQHKGVTNALLQLSTHDELLIEDPWGSINYKGEGVFIAGGAGITPFISIFKHLKAQNELANNQLIFANKTKADIIHAAEFEKMLGDNFINILSDEKTDQYAHGFITEHFIKKSITDLGKYFYVCGPPKMMKAVEDILNNLKVEKEHIIKEEF
ncbi:Ferredoxin-NADP reductase [Saccharicrinis carchari]|uniref:Ferredoxin-NADP reductase n=1 Tax=Saccharicrinis carchari TaxID=1168039 RepID=A0A521BFX6_SACCC|nr:FAD-binding oxidoreductase [Saccharicrinis carchari]SMO45972.1 Ferredoxin-NADP reductase [Saccharicrinis carchari]